MGPRFQISFFISFTPAANGSSLPDLLLHLLHPAHIPIVLSKVPCEVLLGPAVGLLPDLRRWPRAIPAKIDVRLGAILDGPPVLGLVDQTGHVGHTNLCCKLINTGWIPALARSASSAI